MNFVDGSWNLISFLFIRQKLVWYLLILLIGKLLVRLPYLVNVTLVKLKNLHEILFGCARVIPSQWLLHFLGVWWIVVILGRSLISTRNVIVVKRPAIFWHFITCAKLHTFSHIVMIVFCGLILSVNLLVVVDAVRVWAGHWGSGIYQFTFSLRNLKRSLIKTLMSFSVTRFLH